MKKTTLLLATAMFWLCTDVAAQTFTYNFATGYDGWSGDFADYDVDHESIGYDLGFERTTLPVPLDTQKYSLMITGDNHSDDLFMFIKRKVTGLLPNTNYFLYVDVEFASSAPTNGIGVGGAPGEGVIMKAGATLIEPMKEIVGQYYRMNLDKGNQNEEGADMSNIGHVGVAPNNTQFTLISRNNGFNPFSITTDDTGEVWVCIGSDSGFESVTTLYYNNIKLHFTTTLGVDDNIAKSVVVYPNPAKDILHVEQGTTESDTSYTIADSSGRLVASGQLSNASSQVNISGLSKGVYFFTMGQHKAHKFIKQ